MICVAKRSISFSSVLTHVLFDQLEDNARRPSKFWDRSCIYLGCACNLECGGVGVVENPERGLRKISL